MESSWKKPASKMVKGKAAPPLSSEEAQEAAEDLEVRQALDRAAALKDAEDKIGNLIGGKWYIMNWTNPVLAHPNLPQLSVVRFYPEVFVAVDIFVHIGEWEKMQIEYKRKQFKENEVEHGGVKKKVRYGALSYADPLSALAPQLED